MTLTSRQYFAFHVTKIKLTDLLDDYDPTAKSILVQGQLTVPRTTEADLGSTVTLRCRLETEGRWYVISWTRLNDNGSDTLLVSLPSGQMVRTEKTGEER